MNWIKENKFLSGFIAVLAIGAGVLGYLLYTAWGNYSDVSDQYNSQAASLHQYQARVPYPDQANLVKFQAERDDFVDATHDLAAKLSTMVLPVVEMSPSAFQDKLRATITDVVTHAGKTGVKLPDHFAMDFDKYQSSPPSAEAAGPLGRQLAALKIAVDILINEHVDAIVTLHRTPLPQEGGTAGPGPGGPARGQGGFRGRNRTGEEGGGGGGGGEGGLVSKNPFVLQFTSTQPSFQKVLNDFASSSNQFFITRDLSIQNSDPKPVSKVADANAGSAPSATPAAPVPAMVIPGSAPAPAAGATPPPAGSISYLKFIVGTEKLNVSMGVDIVTFNPPGKSNR